jgi:hypothetical protein
MPLAGGSLSYPYVYRWRLRALWGGRDSPFYGRRCQVLARGSMNARLVEFEDGTRCVVSGNALRRIERARQANS